MVGDLLDLVTTSHLPLPMWSLSKFSTHLGRLDEVEDAVAVWSKHCDGNDSALTKQSTSLITLGCQFFCFKSWEEAAYNLRLSTRFFQMRNVIPYLQVFMRIKNSMWVFNSWKMHWESDAPRHWSLSDHVIEISRHRAKFTP